ncbi:MAG: 30S ribosomal protein S4 [Nanoarchaeota archaeon]|nr:30S ribosomal protein S4 [Nanoarchaeota archaeon]
MIHKHKKYSRPKKLFSTERINKENDIVKKYGLKNKKEIWKAKANLDKFRTQAKRLINSSQENQEKFIAKLTGLGFKVENVTEVLALTEVDVLNRRLQSVVFKRGLANTVKEARQLIIHKKVKIDGEIVNIPSYQVKTGEETKIKVIKNQKVKVEKKVETKEDVEKKKIEPKQEEVKNE